MAQSALRNLPLERMNARRERAGMEPVTQEQLASRLGGNPFSQFTSLNTPENMSLGATAADVAMGFLPFVGTAQGVRDFERARRDDDTLGMILGGLSAVPVAGGLVKAGRAAEGALDMSQAARMQRAKDQNFYDRLFYHATTGDFPAFQKSKMGTSSSLGTKEKAVWLSSDPRVAETYLPGQFVNRENAPHTEDIGGGVGRYYSEGSNIMPLRVSLEPEKIAWWDMGGARYNPDDVEEILANARREGMQAVAFKNIRDEGVMGLGSGRSATSLAVFDPKNIRSVNAAFDPAKRNSANLTAGIMGGTVGLSALRQLMPQQEQE